MFIYSFKQLSNNKYKVLYGKFYMTKDVKLFNYD